LLEKPRMKVLLIDDHPLILSALQSVIKGLGNDTVVLGASSAREAREALKADSNFDLVLLDLHLGDADGFDVLVEFRAKYPALPVVVVSASDRSSDVIRAIDAGAMGFVPKRASNETLFEALHMVMSGGIYVPPMTMGSEPAAKPEGDTVPSVLRVLREQAQEGGFQTNAAPLADLGLTPRQTEVLGLLLKGHPNKLIARELNLSVETIKDHVAAVLRTLGVSSRTQAVLAVSQMSSQGGISAWRNSTR
jgi:DNA-binding NarL/FixJ family response regulator